MRGAGRKMPPRLRVDVDCDLYTSRPVLPLLWNQVFLTIYPCRFGYTLEWNREATPESQSIGRKTKHLRWRGVGHQQQG